MVVTHYLNKTLYNKAIFGTMFMDLLRSSWIYTHSTHPIKIQ